MTPEQLAEGRAGLRCPMTPETIEGLIAEARNDREVALAYRAERDRLRDALKGVMSDVEFHSDGTAYYVYTGPNTKAWQQARAALGDSA